ncbi:MAG: adenine phosphoribosyltransferase [Verrucomicrobiota bacterium]
MVRPMEAAQVQKLDAAIRDVPDFPKPGILFKDITPVMADGDLFKLSIAAFLDIAEELGPVDKIVGIDARGFIFGAAVAHHLGIGFIPVRKKGKLPWETESVAYDLEYGSNEVEIHTDAVQPGESVLLVDDLLATGGTAGAAVDLIEKIGGKLLGLAFLIELGFLNGREKLGDAEVRSILTY